MAFVVRDKIVNDFLDNISKELDKKNNYMGKHRKIDSIRYLINEHQQRQK
jgi:hypothetical protein